MTQPFWKPQPREPWHDWRMHSMLIPVLVSAVGFFVTGIFAFAFSDIGVIPGRVQSWLVIIGSGLIVFGAELNTPFTTIEVFRKILRKEANGWDTSALIVSAIGTIVNLLVTFSTRITLPNTWQGFMLNWGPLVAGFAVACDYYGAMVELGFLFGSYELRMEKWLDEKRAYNEANGLVQREPLPQAKLREYRAWTAGMNGRTPRNLDALTELCHERGREPPPESTARRWLKVGRNG